MTPSRLTKRIYSCLIFALILPAVAAESARPDKTLNIGVRAVNGLASAVKMWGSTVDFLNDNVKEYKFKLVPIVGFHDMRTAAKNKNVDFILTNPDAYIKLNKQSGLTRLLTLNKKQPNGIASTTFASLIFTRSDRDDIVNLKDIKNKTIIAVHEEAFGGWRMALLELLNNNIDPYKDSKSVLFTTDNTHQSVVFSVLSGKADVGVVRTGIIEQLVIQKKIELDSIRPLNLHQDELSALHSTAHYPEWPFSVLPHVSNEISNTVFHLLLSIKSNSAAAISGKYISWTAPLDYSGVYKLSKQLSLHHITFEKIWDKYWINIVLFVFFLSAIALYTLYLLSINKKLIQSELDLHEHKIHLEETVEIRTKELLIETERADKANKAKTDFLSNMSHELRTPLTAIIGFTQILEVNEPNNKNIIDATNEITTASNYLLSIINEILDLATIESGNIVLELEPVLCSDILQLSLDIVSPLITKKNITIKINNSSDCSVMADRKRFQQICINLLSNAIKYNKENGEINISIIKYNSDFCEFRIKDSGIGIKPEFFDRIFEPFIRDKSNAHVIEGTGVGLVITKNLVELMNGEIGFNSEYGKGTEFWMKFPVIQA